MGLPRVYRNSGEGEVASVNTTEFLTRQGYVQFHGGKSTASYVLSGNSFYSDVDGRTTRPGGATANDLDFDAPIERSLIIDGQVIVTIPILFVLGAGGSSPVTTTLTATLRKVSNGVESDLGTANASASASMSAGEMTWEVYTLTFDVTAEKIKRDDTLRLTIQTSAPAANEEIVIAHDPRGRTPPTTNSLGVSTLVGGAADTSDLHAWVPFKIDL